MNVLDVNKYHFVSGGPERYMFSVRDLLEQHGHKVVPLALKLEANQPSPYAQYFIPPPTDEKTSHFKDFKLGTIDKIRLATHSVYNWEARRRVENLVHREQIDLVYLLNICNYISPSVIDGAKAAGARVVMRLSDFNFACASYHFFRNGQVCTACQNGLHHAVKYKCMRGSLSLSLARVVAMKIHQMSGIYKKVDAFVAPSKFMADALVQSGMQLERVNYVPSFVNLDQYPPSYERGEYALFFGRLDVEKGVDILLHAWQKLGKNAPTLYIVGSGEAETDLKRMADQLAVHNVSFKTFMNREDLIQVIRKSAFVVVPSLWHDNSPMAVYESMACGKAVIGSKLGGLSDQIKDRISGLLVTPGDPNALAEAVNDLWHNPTKTVELGKTARQRMETVFSPEVHLGHLERIFMA